MKRFISAVVFVLGLGSEAAADTAKFRPRGADAIPGQYIVILDDAFLGRDESRAEAEAPEILQARRDEDRRRVDAALEDLRGLYRFTPQLTWSHAVRGFTMVASRSEAMRMARDPSVLVVEQDARPRDLDAAISVATPSCQTTCSQGATLPLNSRAFPTSPQAITCSNPDPGSLATCIDNWGLDRTDQTVLPRDGSYVFSNSGSGVHVYVVDSGVQASHRELQGKIGQGANVACGDCDLSDVLCNHHGTIVTSVIAGNTYGVARGVTIHPVQITSYCPGCFPNNGSSTPITIPSVSTYVAAFNWIVQHHAANPGPAVSNLSGANSPTYVGSVAFANAARNVITNGISFVQSAGNQNDNACSWSVIQADPTVSVPDAIVVGGVTELAVDGPLRNGRWVDGAGSGSNKGSCLSLWAPAQWVVGAGWDNGVNPAAAFCQLTGTSLAAPHVTGAIARYLQNHPTATPQQVKSALLSGAMPNVLQTSGANSIGTGSPNLLLQFVP